MHTEITKNQPSMDNRVLNKLQDNYIYLFSLFGFVSWKIQNTWHFCSSLAAYIYRKTLSNPKYSMFSHFDSESNHLFIVLEFAWNHNKT